MTRYIRAIKVENGMFSNERIVSLDLDDRPLTLIVDQCDVSNNKLRVNVLDTQDDRSLIDLPREPLNGSGRVVVSNSILVRE
jgi:hypothetical protein